LFCGIPPVYVVASPNGFKSESMWTESGSEVLQTQAECKYKFVHIELVI
jgi:hypothetical protein